jgi:hypothetical protein
MCRKKKSPREEADQFLHICPVPLEAAAVRFVRGDFGEVKETRRRVHDLGTKSQKSRLRKGPRPPSRPSQRGPQALRRPLQRPTVRR